MAQDLDEACHRSADPLSMPPLIVSERVCTGRRGRPHVNIDPNFLSHTLDLRGPSAIGKVLHCNGRTVRRRALEYGLVQPAAPVYQTVTSEDGSVHREYTSTSAPVSSMTDDELDSRIAQALEVFPNFGRRMLGGLMRAQGHRVPREHITLSFARVHGPSNIFGVRLIGRKIYSVPGPNSLWHHDGQHGPSFSPIFSFFSVAHPHFQV